ncbi:MAG TPA: hypothetical protein VFB25_12020 [Gaiellaceae bacterium]|nr:hypothetical protein [Gaiellaceae bacterium]
MTAPELRHVGDLYGSERTPLLLGDGMPLSHLLVRRDGRLVPAARVLAECRGDHLRRRYAVRLEGISPDELLERFGKSAISPVFLVLAETLAFLDPDQIGALGLGLVEQPEPTPIGDLLFKPTYRIDDTRPLTLDGAEAPRAFWRSTWTYADERERHDAEWWRVWPQGERKEVRGDFVAAISRTQFARLRGPAYVMIESVVDPRMRLYAHLRADKGDTQLNSEEFRDRRIVALDASCRDALGILDSEFCRMVPLEGRHVVRGLRRRVFGSRATVAHVKIAARVDLDKPVCRLAADTLAAIGARRDDKVTIETVVERQPGRYRTKREKLRALEIDASEASGRAEWERPTGSDGWVDPATVHGIHPPYPAIYLDWFTRQRLGELPVAAPVIVRANIGSRLAAEAGEFAWLAVGGLVIAVLKGVNASGTTIVVVAGLLSLFFIGFRIRRGLR